MKYDIGKRINEIEIAANQIAREGRTDIMQAIAEKMNIKYQTLHQYLKRHNIKITVEHPTPHIYVWQEKNPEDTLHRLN